MIAHQAMSEEVKQLLKDGLENATYASLKERLAAATQPEHLVTNIILQGRKKALIGHRYRS
jgi:hypothetical protein